MCSASPKKLAPPRFDPAPAFRSCVSNLRCLGWKMLTIIVTLKLNQCLIIKIDGNLEWRFQESLRESEGDFQRRFNVSGPCLPLPTCTFLLAAPASAPFQGHSSCAELSTEMLRGGPETMSTHQNLQPSKCTWLIHSEKSIGFGCLILL